MIRDYFPNLLVEARGKVIEQHPYSENSFQPLSGEEIEELLRQLHECGQEYIVEYIDTLTIRQIEGLADYYCRVSQPKEKIQIEIIIRECMSPRLLKKLYYAWQENPDAPWIFSTFLLNDSDKIENRDEIVKVPHETLLLWHSLQKDGKDYYRAISYDYMSRYLSPLLPFQDAWKKTDFRVGTALYIKCFARYLTKCTCEVLRNESDQDLQEELHSLRIGIEKESVAENLLIQGAQIKTWLLEMRNTYLEIYNYYKSPERACFKSDVAYSAYLWWFNYMELDQGFLETDRRRLRFWMRYIDQCRVKRIRSSGFLIMEFDQAYVVESQEIGRLYFFEKEYYKAQVAYRLASYPAQKAKSWLWNNSQRYCCITHYSGWQADAAHALSLYAHTK